MEQTDAMQRGIMFEAMVRNAAKGIPLEPGHEWAAAVNQAGAILEGSAEQVRFHKTISLGGQDFLLVGVADNIKAGIIYDTKFSKNYQFGKFASSPQHPAYFALWPLAVKFTYLVCDGNFLYQESYQPFDTVPIEAHISQFMRYLKANNLTEIYEEHWRIA